MTKKIYLVEIDDEEFLAFSTRKKAKEYLWNHGVVLTAIAYGVSKRKLLRALKKETQIFYSDKTPVSVSELKESIHEEMQWIGITSVRMVS